MNPSTALATTLVDELVRGGVTEAVLSPGSRSAPLAFALHRADADGRLRLHVRIDERTAGFLALGLAKASGRPVPVVTTSGTAAVNLHPAVVEAAYSGVPLVALTADRPPELRGVGANQAIDQVGLFGSDVSYAVDLVADSSVGQVEGWRSTIAEALAAARSGPVHVNVGFREPLLPDGDDRWVEPLDGDVARSSTAASRPDAGVVRLEPGPRTLVVAGDGAGDSARRLAESASWPLLAEPTSGARGGPNALAAYRLLLATLGAAVERVVLFGRPTLSRPVAQLLARPGLELVVVEGGSGRGQFRRRSSAVAAAVTPSWIGTGAPRATPDPWLRQWLDADAVARKVIAEVLGDAVSGPAVARAVASVVPQDGLLFVGSSASIRDLDIADPWDEPPLVLANRGVAGIDGTVSTALGAALAHDGDAFALLGDLTFLHDSNGLVLGADEPRPALTFVVNNDDGGGIFGQLEQGAPEHAAVFERVFGTPHGVDIASLCAATATPHELVTSEAALRDALAARRSGIRVVEVRTDRSRRRDLDRRMRDGVTAATTTLRNG